jgi:hypothetical protein
VDVAIHPERGLVAGRAGCRIRHRRQPEIAAFVTLAEAFQPHQLRVFLCKGVQDVGQISIAIKAVKMQVDHCTSLSTD